MVGGKVGGLGTDSKEKQSREREKMIERPAIDTLLFILFLFSVFWFFLFLFFFFGWPSHFGWKSGRRHGRAGGWVDGCFSSCQ